MLTTDIVIIGAGPVGLFTVFEAGMMKMKCHVVDSLDFVGGQCTALYPEKPIYDIPAHPQILAEDLIINLEKQAAPFLPTYHLGQTVTHVERDSDGWKIKTSKDTSIKCKAIIIAAGCGAFGPNRPPIPGIEEYEGKSIFYMVNKKEDFRGKDVVIAGGGDSAVDWALSLTGIANSISVIHRRAKFRCAPDSHDKLNKLVDEGKINMVVELKADVLLPFFGLAMELGPIANWGLKLDKQHIAVDPSTMQTNVEGIFAIGDIATYKNKLKLILSGFAESAMACQTARGIVHPGEAIHFEYSTTMGIPG
ncbi:MAG: Ferredoxin--NADP reductase [Rickettsiaceae bacterium]|nr:Ferredoxin--NADP reductase [Rickettsiaceae bacterium]